MPVPMVDVPVPADGKPAGGGMPAARCPHSRAVFRSAQNLLFFQSILQAPCAFRGADGGTVGGSAGAFLPRLRHPADVVVGCAVTALGCSWLRMVPLLGTKGALLVAVWHTAYPVDPPGGTHRQPRAVYKYWPGMRRSWRRLWMSLRSSSSSTSSPSSSS